MQTAVSLAKAGMSWIQLLGMGFIGSIGAMVDSGLGGASKFDMVMAMLQGFGIGVLGFAFVSVIAQLSASVRALAALFGSISSLTGGIVAARDSYEEGKFEQAAFRLLMGIFGCIMGARDYRNALRDCNVSVVVDETPNGGGGRGCVGDESETRVVEVDGKSVTIDDSLFDPNFIDNRGRTNIQRMQQGLAPIGTDGRSVNIHHIDQTNDGPVMEILATEHQQNYSILHENVGQSPSQIDRNEFAVWRRNYWPWRANN